MIPKHHAVIVSHVGDHLGWNVANVVFETYFAEHYSSNAIWVAGIWLKI